MKNQSQINHEIAQHDEASWWGNCANMLGEELKQLVYAQYMGIEFHESDGKPYQIDLKNQVIVDIGGGPNSLLLKGINGKQIVIDPCEYPQWINERYWYCNIEWIQEAAEKVDDERYSSADEVWIYNVLQHVIHPEKVIKKAKLAKKIRIFEWIDAGTNHAHPHELTEEKLNAWLDTKGHIIDLTGHNGCWGKAYFAEV